jgi:ATP-binding cassette, subfamily C (CFTR/MRP), member 4
MNHQKSKTKPSHPWQKANRLSKMTFWWIKDLYMAGMKRPIVEEDIYETLSDHDCEKVAKKFTKLWEFELKSSSPSTLRMFYNAYGLPVILIGLLFSVFETLNRCAQPLLLGELLTYFAEENSSKNIAYLYAGGIVLCSLFPVLTFHPFIHYIFGMALKIKVGSSRLVYDKVKLKMHGLTLHN